MLRYFRTNSPTAFVCALILCALILYAVIFYSTSPTQFHDTRLALELKEYVQFPASHPTPRPSDTRLQGHARINYIGEVPDGSGRLYTPDLNGVLYLVIDSKPIPYLDVRSTLGSRFWASSGLGSGLGFAAFHPDFSSNGLLYTTHTEKASSSSDVTDWEQSTTELHGVLSEWHTHDPTSNRFHGTRREVLRFGFSTRLHGIQQIAFNPTSTPGDKDYGLLYLSVGDGGTGRSNSEPQDLALPFGKILRIDPLGKNSKSGKYGIPPNNPFVRRHNALGEIYVYGLRDPHRFSWDTQLSTDAIHHMYLGDIGEKAIENIYRAQAGDNFGWSEHQGNYEYNDNDRCSLLPISGNRGDFIPPIAAYEHKRTNQCPKDAGFAISAGFMYRGSITGLSGKYIFGDIVTGDIMYLEESEMNQDPGHLATIYSLTVIDPKTKVEMTMNQLLGSSRVDLRFGYDNQHNLYLLSKTNGTIWVVTGVREIEEKMGS